MEPAPVFIFGQLIPCDASPCVCIPHSFISFDRCPSFPPPSFVFRCVAFVVLALVFLSELSCTTYMVIAFLSLLRRMFILPYAYYMWLSFVYFVPICLLIVDRLFWVPSWQGCPLQAIFTSSSFCLLTPVCLFCFVCLRPCSFPICLELSSVYLVTAAGFVADRIT